jgi:selenide,water dikinase
VLRHLKPSTDPLALVGTETSDDAAVYRIGDAQAIVETVDFFTPVVDDPYWFGRIAAANAFSDVWAMGGRPLFALNIVAWPVATLPMEQLGEVLRGGAETAALAGASILGGHSIDDPEPKYGLAVTGIVHPDRILRNVGARPGDRLLLTKPLGTGVATTAIKRGVAPAELVERVVAGMAALNRAAGETFAASGRVHALTDVTGFGLLGHGWEMASGSGVSLRIRAGAVPIHEGVRALAEQGLFPGGSKANFAWVEPNVRFAAEVDETTRRLLADAQTNGGLLAAVDAGAAGGLLDALRAAGVAAVEVGEVLAPGPGEPPRIEVVA